MTVNNKVIERDLAVTNPCIMERRVTKIILILSVILVSDFSVRPKNKSSNSNIKHLILIEFHNKIPT